MPRRAAAEVEAEAEAEDAERDEGYEDVGTNARSQTRRSADAALWLLRPKNRSRRSQHYSCYVHVVDEQP